MCRVFLAVLKGLLFRSLSTQFHDSNSLPFWQRLSQHHTLPAMWVPDRIHSGYTAPCAFIWTSFNDSQDLSQLFPSHLHRELTSEEVEVPSLIYWPSFSHGVFRLNTWNPVLFCYLPCCPFPCVVLQISPVKLKRIY